MISPLRLLLSAAAACIVSSAPSPNLVFVLTDDAGYGSINEAIHTPSIKSLMAEGVTADMYSVRGDVWRGDGAHVMLIAHCFLPQYRFCSPSRASFLTGRYPWRITSTLCDNRVCNYLPATIPMGTHLGYSMLPKRLQEKGYVSYHVGKCV